MQFTCIGRCLILSWLSFEILSNAASKILSFSGMYNPIEPLNSKSSDVNPNFSGSFSIGASFNSKKLFAAIISMQSVFSVKKFKVFSRSCSSSFGKPIITDTKLNIPAS